VGTVVLFLNLDGERQIILSVELRAHFRTCKLYTCTQIPPREREREREIKRAFKIDLALPSTPLCHLTLCGERIENRSGTYRRTPMIHPILRASPFDVPEFRRNHRDSISPVCDTSFSRDRSPSDSTKESMTRTRARPTKRRNATKQRTAMECRYEMGANGTFLSYEIFLYATSRASVRE